MRPKLKPFARLRGTAELCLVRENGVEITLDDPDGRVSDLLDLLDGTRNAAELTAALAARWPDTRTADVALALHELDAAGLVEDAAAPCRLSRWQQERYFSNLAFFETFARLDRSRFELQEALAGANVLLLGVGGLGSSLLLHLAGLGVGHITVLDRDRVELRNLSRQFLYSEADVGASKLSRAVARARTFNSEPAIAAVERDVRRPEDIDDLLDGVDLVLSGIDRPREVHSWVNDACVKAQVPFVTGGMQVTRGLYFSVAPGDSACLACLQTAQERAHAALLAELRTRPRTNRGIAPVASLVAGLVGLEAVRYLTGFAPPVAAGRLWVADLVAGHVDVGLEWPRLEDCPVCATPVAGAVR